MSEIEGYRLDAVHAFRVRTLSSLGYETRVVLANASQTNPAWATPYRVDVSCVPPLGPPRRVASAVAEIPPGERRVLECAPFCAGVDGDCELVFHLVPLRLLAGARDELVGLSRAELFFYFNVQDHFVEYHRADGFSAGVLYQSGAFNYDLFSRERSTIIQAPKVFISDAVDTFVSLAHGSADPDYRATAELRCALVTEDGRRTTWVERLPAFSLALLSMRDRARALGGARFCSFYAVCDHATLVPLTIQRNDATGAIGIEHSLPPIYYASAMRGPMRASALTGLSRSSLFREAP